MGQGCGTHSNLVLGGLDEVRLEDLVELVVTLPFGFELVEFVEKLEFEVMHWWWELVRLLKIFERPLFCIRIFLLRYNLRFLSLSRTYLGGLHIKFYNYNINTKLFMVILT